MILQRYSNAIDRKGHNPLPSLFPPPQRERDGGCGGRLAILGLAESLKVMPGTGNLDPESRTSKRAHSTMVNASHS